MLVVILATVALQVFSLLILLPIDQVFGSIALDEGPIGGAVPCRSCRPVLQSNNVPRQLPQMSIATYLICNGHVAVFRPQTDSEVQQKVPESISKVPREDGL